MTDVLLAAAAVVLATGIAVWLVSASMRPPKPPSVCEAEGHDVVTTVLYDTRGGTLTLEDAKKLVPFGREETCRRCHERWTR